MQLTSLLSLTVAAGLAVSTPASALAVPSCSWGGDDGKSGAAHPFELEEHRTPRLDTAGGALIRGATVHSAVSPARVADVLVMDGKIAAILPAGEGQLPDGAVLLEAEGLHLAPGAVDTHSHMAIERGINEATLSITADCDITDVINADDLAIYRALAGGTTTIQCLHGSANAIGGRSEVLKLKWKRPVEELRFPGAPQGIKFALGENPKRANWGEFGARFPASRMGVEAVFDRGFRRAQEYRAEWEAYEAARRRGEDPAPPRRDVRLDVLVGILEGEVKVHSHSYRADEILMLLRAAERYGFRVQTLQHVLEGYKIAHEIAEHGAMTSTFSDWWGYKLEAYDAIPQNAALLDEAGVVSTINSDSNELVRHLYLEAAKSMRYTDIDPVRCLALATLNCAIQLGVDDRVGSIEVGKDADLVLLTAQPLSVYARVQWTMVDGQIEFERRDAFELDGEPLPLRELSEVRRVEAVFDPEGGDVLAIVGGTLHPVTGDSIEDGTLLIQDGRIAALGADLELPAGATVVDASGRHVWPGMIALDTGVGLLEIDSVRGSVDTSETGGSQPDIRVTSSIHPDSSYVGVTRTGGVTRTQVAPQGGGPWRGQSAVVRLAGETWEELTVIDRDMLHLNFPGGGRRRGSEEKKDKKPEVIAELSEELEEAREYARLQDDARREGTQAPPFDTRLEALAPYARGEKTVAIHVGSAQGILWALEFIAEEGLDAVLYDAREAWKVVDHVAEAGVPLAIGPVLALPRSQYDPYDAAYANAAVLHRAGVRFAIHPGDTSNARHAGIQAGHAVAYGLPYEEALRAVTLYPAELLGIDDEVGSLEVGKVADVVITDGDLLEATTQVLHVLVDGVPQDVKNRQTRLYERYRERLHRKQGR